MLESRKRNKIFNGIMILAVLCIIIGSTLFVGNTLGWFLKEERISSADIIGNVQITRNGIAYLLKSDSVLKEGDEIKTGAGDTAKIIIDGNKHVSLNENTSVLLKADQKKNQTEIILHSGEIFCEIDDKLTGEDYFRVSGEKFTVEAKGTVLSVSNATEVITVNTFEGSVNLLSKEKSQTIDKGQSGLLLSNTDEIVVDKLEPGSLSEFILNRAINVGKDRSLCFTPQELKDILTARAEEADKIRQEAQGIAVAAGDEQVNGGDKSTPAKDGKSSATSSETKDKNSSGSNNQGNSNSAGSVSNTNPEGEGTSTDKAKTCTISIRCDTILNNMGDLTSGKDKFVPSSGVILGTTKVEFSEGETVLDVLKRICSVKGLHLEYRFTPAYDSYYIEGINQLYEFDCGPESGWMYKVNGRFPNYGCSQYKLKDGDVIVWCYTCKGLGADVGGRAF